MFLNSNTIKQIWFNLFHHKNIVNKKTLLKDVSLIAVDFETTGLNPAKDEIISMGFCPIYIDSKNNGVIKLNKTQHFLVQTEKKLTSNNVIIHGITDETVEQGITPEAVFQHFMHLTENKVIIAHYHQIERHFIQKLAKKVTGKSISINFIDTFFIAKKQIKNKQRPIKTNALRLFNLRKNFGLPNYKAHNALEDAISTAELFLAQQASLNIPFDQIRLKQLGLFKYKS